MNQFGDQFSSLDQKVAAALSKLDRREGDAKDIVRGVCTELDKIGPAHKSTIELLAKLLDRPEVDLRVSAANKISLFGLDAASAVPRLANLVYTGKVNDRIDAHAAACALGGITTVESIDALRAAARFNNVTAQMAISALALLDHTAEPALIDLMKVYHNTETKPSVRSAAGAAIKGIQMGIKRVCMKEAEMLPISEFVPKLERADPRHASEIYSGLRKTLPATVEGELFAGRFRFIASNDYRSECGLEIYRKAGRINVVLRLDQRSYGQSPQNGVEDIASMLRVIYDLKPETTRWYTYSTILDTERKDGSWYRVKLKYNEQRGRFHSADFYGEKFVKPE